MEKDELNGSQEEIKTDGPGEDDAGRTEDTPDYGGFESPEALVADYIRVKGEADDLSGLKGRQGKEIGDLKSEVSRLGGTIEALKEVKKSDAPTYDVHDLERQYTDGDITLAQYTQRSNEAVRSQMKEDFKQELGTFKTELERQSYVDRFIVDNPGYVETFDAGKLSKWTDRGMSGENAWREYRLENSGSELETLRKENEELKKQVQSEGLQNADKIKQGKDAAGKVLGNDGDTTSFSRGDNKPVIRNHEEQVDAAYDLIQRM